MYVEVIIIVLAILLAVFFFGPFTQRYVVYALYEPMTKRPWTPKERWQFKWLPWFDWTTLENAYDPPYDPASSLPFRIPKSHWTKR